MQTSTPDKIQINDKLPQGHLFKVCNENASLGDNSCQLHNSISSFMSSPTSDRERGRSPSKDEFWDALSSHYDYLMDDGLIATCREASSDLSWDDDEEVSKVYCWSYTQFIEQFKRLHDMLHQLQTEHVDEDANKNVLEDQKKVGYLCKLFNEQGQKLSRRYPDMRDEVLRHLNLLNNKWEAVEQSINPNKTQPAKDGIFDEITYQMRCLRRWLRELESRLCPLSFKGWSLEKLEAKLKEQQVLQKEIEAKGKYVSSLLKLCERLEGNVKFGQHSLIWDAERVQRVANNLQHRWHSIWLRSLECHCIIEDLIYKLKAGSVSSKLERSFSEEPLKKYPRLSLDRSFFDEAIHKLSSPCKFTDENSLLENNSQKCYRSLMNSKEGNSIGCSVKESTSDKGVMVGDTSIAQMKKDCAGNFGKFEIIQDVGYSSETSAHLSSDDRLDVPNGNSPDIIMDDVTFIPKTENVKQMYVHDVESVLSDTPRKIYLAPDKYPSFTLKRCQALLEDKSLSNLKYKDYKSVPEEFYQMTSVDSDSLDEASGIKILSEDFIKTVLADESCHSISHLDQNFDNITSNCSDNQNKDNVDNAFLVHGLAENNCDQLPVTSFTQNSEKPGSSSCHSSVQNTLKTSKQGAKGNLTQGQVDGKRKSSVKVREWLNTCKLGNYTSDEGLEQNSKENKTWRHETVVDSSCDASGEYTTTESDGERSAVSDDINNSLTQSFTGSVETVVPAATQEQASIHTERSGSAEPSPSVKLRKKKRQNRDRPWSVTEIHQVAAEATHFPHSTSEGALHTLDFSTEDVHNVSCSKKLCLESEHAKESLTDASATSHSSKSKSRSRSSHNSGNHSDSASDGIFSRRKKHSSRSSKSSHCSDGHSHTNAKKCLYEKHSASSHNSCSSKHNYRKQKRSLKSTSSAEGLALAKASCNKENNHLESKLVSSTKATKLAPGSTDEVGEDQSSVSDQVWDEYQDPPYLSEPYSEPTADEEQIKKLISFGDDYRAVLGSHSDASSIVSKNATRKAHGRTHSRKLSVDANSCDANICPSDSDSDTEDFQNILLTSRHALQFVSYTFKEICATGNLISSPQFAELIATCDTNLCHLHAVHDELINSPDLSSFSADDLHRLQELIREWEVLQVQLLIPQQPKDRLKPVANFEDAVREVRTSMASLKNKLSEIWCNASEMLNANSNLDELESDIHSLQADLATLQEMKRSVLSVSARVLRLLAEGNAEIVSPLRNEAAKIYQQWEEVYEQSSSQLTHLQALYSHLFQSSESELQQLAEAYRSLNKDEAHVFPPEVEETVSVHINKSKRRNLDNLRVAAAEVEKLSEDVDSHVTAVNLSTHSSVGGLKVAKSNIPDSSTSATVFHYKSRLWRVLRAAMPIQFALVILYCMSCLLEPNCCENVNNFEFSVFPQLRHIRGPPPV